MSAYHAIELLVVTAIVGTAAWHVWRRWRRRPATGRDTCGGCDKCAPHAD